MPIQSANAVVMSRLPHVVEMVDPVRAHRLRLVDTTVVERHVAVVNWTERANRVLQVVMSFYLLLIIVKLGYLAATDFPSNDQDGLYIVLEISSPLVLNYSFFHWIQWYISREATIRMLADAYHWCHRREWSAAKMFFESRATSILFPLYFKLAEYILWAFVACF